VKLLLEPQLDWVNLEDVKLKGILPLVQGVCYVGFMVALRQSIPRLESIKGYTRTIIYLYKTRLNY